MSRGLPAIDEEVINFVSRSAVSSCATSSGGKPTPTRNKLSIDPLSFPGLLQLGADRRPDGFLLGCGERAALDIKQEHIRPDLLRPQRRHPDRDLDELVEVVRDQVIVRIVEVLAHRVLDHLVVGGDHEGGSFKEQEETDRLKCRYRGLRKAAVQVVDEHNERNFSSSSASSNDLRSAAICWRGFRVVLSLHHSLRLVDRLPNDLLAILDNVGVNIALGQTLAIERT